MAKTPVGRKRTPAAAAKPSAARTRTTTRKSAEKSAEAPAPRTKAAPTRTTVSRAPKLPPSVAAAVKAMQAKQAENIVVLDLRKSGGFTDYFVICTGANARQIVAIADAIRETLKRDFQERPTVEEGLDRAEWVLLDYFDFVVHIFSRDCRAFYNLERLWGNAERTSHDD